MDPRRLRATGAGPRSDGGDDTSLPEGASDPRMAVAASSVKPW